MTWISSLNLPKAPRPIARPPASVDGQLGAEIGRVLELALDGSEVRFSGSKPKLLWLPDIDSLCWFVDAKTPRATTLVWNDEMRDHSTGLTTDQSSVDAFNEFMGRGPKPRAWTYGLTGKSIAWYSIGAATRIDYSSDKHGRRTKEYTHTLGRSVRLYVCGPKRAGPSFWMLRGGRLRLTARGIEG